MAREVVTLKHVFLVGCQRSGTSWLQLLLAQHPSVATTQETHLFNHYLRPLRQRWEAFRNWPSAIGMRAIFTDEEFRALCRNFAGSVMERIASTNPGATVVLEKTPDHVREASFILELFPEAYFIHLVRDPRSVVSSLRAAASSWGSSWASPSVRQNAKLWVSAVKSGRAIAGLTDRFRELRYEDLRSESGPQLLVDLLAWLDLPGDLDFAARAFEACRIDRLREGGRDVRGFDVLKRGGDFFRKGAAEGWKDDLSPAEVEVVEYIAAELMREYGYRLERPVQKKPLRLGLAELVDRTDGRLRRYLEWASARWRLRA